MYTYTLDDVILYLNDKIDPAFRKEIDKSIYIIINKLGGDNCYE